MTLITKQDNLHEVNYGSFYRANYCEDEKEAWINFVGKTYHLELREADLLEMLDALKTAKTNAIDNVKRDADKRIAKIKGDSK